MEMLTNLIGTMLDIVGVFFLLYVMLVLVAGFSLFVAWLVNDVVKNNG